MFEDHEIRAGGKRYVPQMLALPMLELADWLRDDLPDLLWPAALWVRGGYEEGRLLGQCLEAAGEALGEVEVPFDGRLTGIEQVPQELRQQVLDAIDLRVGLDRAIPEQLRLGMRLFDDYPGRWFVQASSPGEARVPQLVGSRGRIWGRKGCCGADLVLRAGIVWAHARGGGLLVDAAGGRMPAV